MPDPVGGVLPGSRGKRGPITLLLHATMLLLVMAAPGVLAADGGVGVVATGGADIVVCSSVSGGLAADGLTRAPAVELSGGGNTLTLENGYSFAGLVNSGGGDELVLGGDGLTQCGQPGDGSLHVDTAFHAAFSGFDSFAKEGASTWILTGVDPGMDWQIRDGTLEVRGDFGATGVTATGRLAGDGTLANPTTLAVGGVVAPGRDAGADVGTLTAAGLDWHGGGSVDFQLGSTPAQSDYLALTGALNQVSGAGFTFHFTDGTGTPQVGTTYPLIGFDSVAGFDAADFSFDYTGAAPTLLGHFELTGSQLQFVVDGTTLEYTLTASVSGSGSVSASGDAPVSGTINQCTSAGIDCAAVYADGANVNLTATPDPGHHLLAWSGDCSGSTDSVVLTMDADKACSAAFAINVYTVTFVDWDGTVLAVQHIDHGDPAVAPADPVRTGYTFSGWDVAFDHVTGDLTVTAQYAINSHHVGGTVSGLQGSGLVLQLNGSESLPVSGDGGFTFATALDYGSSYAVTVLNSPDGPAQTCSVANGSGNMPDADVTDIAVVCSTTQHTVTGVVGSGNGSITPPTQSVADGSTASLTVTADGSWHIDVVTGCGGTLSGNTYTTGPIFGDCTVTATFAADVPVAAPVAVPTLDWRMLLLLAGLMGAGAGVSRVRRRI